MLLKIKKVQLMIFVMLIVLTSTLLLTTVFAFPNRGNTDASLKAQASAYVISGSGKISKDTYKAYANFEINSAEGLLGFARNTTNIDGYPKFDWAGKTICLTSNINCSSIEWTSVGGAVDTLGLFPFKGTFDGGYYTISNLTTSRSIESSKWYSPNNPQVALFAYLDGATVKRVNVDGINVYTRDENTPDQIGEIAVAGIANSVKNGSKISECSVNNLSFSYNSPSGGVLSIGGIASGAFDNCIIENCYVENFDVNINSVDYMLDNDYCTVSGIANSNSNFPNLRYCIFAKDKKNCESLWNLPSNVNSDYISYGDAFDSTCYYDNDIDEIMKIFFISKIDNNSTWFYDEEYNAGYPILTDFVKNWVRYGFRENSSSTRIQVEDSSLWVIGYDSYSRYYNYFRTVPYDICKVFNTNTPEVQIGSAYLDVNVSNPVFEFSHWSYGDYYGDYVPITKRISYILTFMNSNLDYANMIVDGNQETNYDIEAVNGAEIKMSISITNGIITYKYEIIESNKTKETILFVMNSPKYTMAEDRNGYMDNGLNGVDKYEITSAMTIEPGFCLKSYNIELK